jgi:aryl-alcohol dehydrogenase-like predicted oxidoreductase
MGRNDQAGLDRRHGKNMYQITEANDREVVRAVEAVARERGVSMAEVALAWLLSKDVITSPIVGASKLGHVEDAIKALDLKLSDEEIGRLEAPYRTRSISGFA